jgi:hypothetical protein
MSDQTLNDLELVLGPQELASTVEALWDMVRDRLFRTIRPTPAWKDLNWQLVQEILDSTTQAYTKAMMLFSEMLKGRAAPEFIPMFSMETVIWDALADVTKATGWPSMKLHLDHPVTGCVLCATLSRTQLG